MKHFISTLVAAFLVCNLSLSAQVVNVQTTGVAKVDNQSTVTYYENDYYSFTIAVEQNMVVITKNRGSSFNLTWTYKIEYATTIYDNVMGKGMTFAISRNNVLYVMTMTRSLITFSRSGDLSRMWHFYLASIQ